jgi:hypothetical protein
MVLEGARDMSGATAGASMMNEEGLFRVVMVCESRGGRTLFHDRSGSCERLERA